MKKKHAISDSKSKILIPILLCGIPFFISACWSASTTENEMPLTQISSPAQPQQEGDVKRASRGIEIKTALEDYSSDYVESGNVIEYRALGVGFGNTDKDAIEEARDDARRQLRKKLNKLSKHKDFISETEALIIEAKPDPWDYDDGRTPRFKVYFGVGIHQEKVTEILAEIQKRIPVTPTLPAPLSTVSIFNKRFPAEVSFSSAKNVYDIEDYTEFFVYTERDSYLTIFSLNKRGDSIVFLPATPLKKNERFAGDMHFDIEDPDAMREECLLVFVLTSEKKEFGHKNEVFSSDLIAEWLNEIPEKERFVYPYQFAIER